jgi:putative phosphoserine phosphatase/1-acylglycerol-3-phosphate O-acyltransferase
VGTFKKGPFRIAMAVGIPIVPIVIRNAEIVAARNSTTINPGTVDVAVFPPIPVDDWTLDTLPEHIAEVRQLYLDTLANWPVDELPEVDLYAEKKAAPKKHGKARPPAAKTAAKKTAKKVASKAPAQKTAAKTTAAGSMKKTQPKTTAKMPAKANPKPVADKDGQAKQPSADQTVGAESTSSRPRGRP